MDQDYRLAMRMALNVDFLKEESEIKAYADSLYAAMQWGRKVK